MADSKFLEHGVSIPEWRLNGEVLHAFINQEGRTKDAKFAGYEVIGLAISIAISASIAIIAAQISGLRRDRR